MKKSILLWLIACIYQGTITVTVLALHKKNDACTWSHNYKKEFNAAEIVQNTQRKNIIFCKTGMSLFSQLIFYWNSFRPEKGYFSFSAQVLDEKNKWHDWHPMIDWGKDIQKSYFNTALSGTKYCHVRLEMPPHLLGQGVRIKVVAHDGANLSSLRVLGANASNLLAFKEELPAGIEHLPTIMIDGIPKQSQMVLDHPQAEVMCSPTSCSMLTSYLKKQPVNAVDFACNVHDEGLDSFGSWPFNVAHAFEQCDGDIFFRVARLPSFIELHSMLQKSIPVVVSVRGKLDGAPREYKNGHLLVVVGWDREKQKVLCHDPAFESNEKVYTEYDVKSFCQAWGRSRHLSYIAEPAY